jgi:hypothetical protein
MSTFATLMAERGWPALFNVLGDSATITRQVGDPQTCPAILTRNLKPEQVEGIHVTHRDALIQLRWSDLGAALSKGDTVTINSATWTVQRCVQDDDLVTTYLVRSA